MKVNIEITSCNECPYVSFYPVQNPIRGFIKGCSEGVWMGGFVGDVPNGIHKDCKFRKNNKYVLRWQRGLTNDEVKIHYTYGHIDMLREKAKVMAQDEKILYVTIDKIEEVIKDTRTEEFIKRIKGETL